ncbi:alpha-L-fucosidase 1 [Dorcoceras hygrometricum]|uniref:alpha-L-fucosidase n=1 Tax=Dorcoceras hygrometricum TaxID=472368 RepID=A0A2Z7CLB7_9LAMI|nr:alpha-L-fucosidase 1 [Dorcoceras hygrometricum]
MFMKSVADFGNERAFTGTLNFPQSVSSRYVVLIILSITVCFQQSKSSVSNSVYSRPTLPPIPVLPIPTSRQISWQLSEMAMFFHFGPNTFTDSEWGTGQADPSVFNPTAFNATQWVAVAKDTGFSRVILTVKHHDGFCLWPSEYTDYSVKSTSWKNGTGDVVKELAHAARIAGLELGLYLSPWDRHEPCYGNTLEYNEYYMGQMTELLTWYGDIKEIWLDGAKGENEKDMEYFFNSWFSLIHQLQPEAIIFSDDGPDSRWIGDEAGVARTTCWSLFNRSAIKIGQTATDYLGEGDPEGPDWVPAECDVSIRAGWFWHASEAPKSALTLLDIYYTSAGRNCLFLLNVPPNSSGLISPEDIKVLQEFAEIRNSIFSHNLAKRSLVWASNTRGGPSSTYGAQLVLEDGIYSYWAPDKAQSDWELFFEFQEDVTFNVLLIQEPIQMGQRVKEFRFLFLNEKGEWEEITRGTTVGYKRLLLFPSVTSRHLKLEIVRSRGDPLISYVGLYVDRFSTVGHVSLVSSRSPLNGSASSY